MRHLARCRKPDGGFTVRSMLCLLLLSTSLAACGGNEVRDSAPTGASASLKDQLPPSTTLVYDCNGFEFVARLGPGEMALWLPERYLVLSQVRSGSGSKYQEGDIVFWSKGDEAMLSVGNQRYEGCRLRPERAPWEDARRRGVDFRAVGNEPGWYLEIQRDRQLLFVGDYGGLRLLMPDPGEEVDGPTRSYHAVTAEHELRVEIVDGPCADTMSGESFPSQVLVQVGGRTLSGCGRRLDYPWE
jgi:membrane-bound inhibitor of C-type lysozyme/uncharacterized membrane protein